MPVYIPANNQDIVAIPDVWEEVVKRMDDDVKRRRQEELVSAMGVQPQQQPGKKQNQQEEQDNNSSFDNEILRQLMNRGSTGTSSPMAINGMQGMSMADFPASSIAMSEAGAAGLPEGMSMVNGAPQAGATGGSSGATSLMSNPIGWILAMIGSGLVASNNIDHRTEGVKSKGVLKGHFFTDPFSAKGRDWIGSDESTQGELVDAAIANKDYGKAAKRSLLAGDIGGDMIGIGGRRYLGKTGGDLLQAMLAPFMFWGQKTFGK